MLFNKLLPLLADVTLSFTVSAKDDKISVTVVPKSTKDSKKAISNTPLAISGTADEMDEQFVDEIEKALGKVVGFMSNADKFVESVKEEANAEKASPKKTEPSKTTAPAVKEEKAKVLTPAQKKVVTAGQESLKRAKDAMGKGDTDMVEFLRKGTIKSYKDAKMDDKAISELETLFNNIKPSEATENDLFTPGKEPVNGKTEEIEDVQEPDVEDPDEETDIIETNDPDEENDQVDDDDIF